MEEEEGSIALSAYGDAAAAAVATPSTSRRVAQEALAASKSLFSIPEEIIRECRERVFLYPDSVSILIDLIKTHAWAGTGLTMIFLLCLIKL